MLTTIIATLLKFGPWLVGVAGVVFAAFRHQQASTATAKAAQREAEADAKVAQMERTESEADAAAERAKAEALKERANVEDQIAVGAAGESADRLRSEWSRD
jgi:ATP synthase E chain